MENQQTNTSLFGLQLNETSKNHLLTLSTWATIVAIAAMISSVISLIGTLTAKPEVIQAEGFSYRVQQSSGGNAAGAIIGLIIAFVLNYFLYMFGKYTKKGVESINQGDINSGFTNLKIYFQIYGILLIILIFFVLIAILGVSASA